MGIRYWFIFVAICAALFAGSASSFAQADPAAEPTVLAVAKVLPAVFFQTSSPVVAYLFACSGLT
jgi:hypothetical protein